MAKAKSSRKRQTRRSPRSKQGMSVAQVVPNALVSCKLVNQCARWETKSNLANAPVSAQNLIACLNIMAATSALGYSTFWSIRIRKIIFYSPAVISSATSGVVFEWKSISGQLFGSEPANYNSGSLGTANGSRYVFKPPKDMPWSNWITLLSPGGVTCFTFTAPAGTTIDIHYDAYIDDADGSVSMTLSGATVGANYRMGLDLLPTASSSYIVAAYRSN